MKTTRELLIGGRNIWPILAGVLLLTIQAHAQYLGVTCGFNYDNDLTGPYTDCTNVSIFNPISGNPNATWSNWAEELKQSGVDFVCPNLRGSQPNTGVSPTNIAPFVTALDNEGNVTKLAIFDDNASSWTAQYNQALGHGYDYTVPFDISNTNNWRYIYDWNYKLFYQTVPSTNLFTINGRPVIIIWSCSTTFITNAQGNASRAITYVRTRCQADFGFNPFIVLSGDFFQNDTTCIDAGIADGAQDWFTPTATPYTLNTAHGASIGVAVSEFHDAGNSSFIDPNHGVTFDTGLSNTVGAGALLTLCEGFTDWEEDAAIFRVRNLDTKGNPLSYSETYYDYPNQRISILRKHSHDPFPQSLKFEAEGCDSYGGAVGGNGQVNYYRNGNIAIEITSDIGGGYDVGWIASSEWLQWENVPLNGPSHFVMRVATPNNGVMAHFVIDGVPEPSQAIPNTGGYQTYTNVDFGSYGSYSNSYHTVELVFDNGGEKINWWETLQTIPSFYTGSNYSRSSVFLGVGSYTTAQLQSAGLPANALASVRVPSGYTVTLYSSNNFTGNSLVLTTNAIWLSDEDFQNATASITITAPLGPATQLGVVSPPSSIATAGVALAAQPQVAVEDSYGNVITNATGTITVSETANGNLNGAIPSAMSASINNGMAVFSGLFFTNAGLGSLTFSDGSLAGLTWSGITVNGNVENSMAMQTEPPASAEGGVPFTPQPAVLIEDVYGNPVTNNTAVTVTAGLVHLLGATNVVTTNGVATFGNLICTNVGSVTLTFYSGSLTATSTVVNVTPGPVTSVAWTTQPGQAGAGAPFAQQPVLQSVDVGGNPSTVQLPVTNLVSISLLSGAQLIGGPLLVNIGTAGSNGTVAFQNLQINSLMTNAVLVASVIGAQLSPTNGISNCVLWLDAAATNTFTLSGGTISTWADKSGTTNNATSTGTRPSPGTSTVLSSSAWGGQRVVTFNNSGHFNVNLQTLRSNAYTIIAMEVAAGNSAGAQYFLQDAYTGSGTDGVLGFGYRNTTEFTIQQYVDDINYTQAAGWLPVQSRLWTGILNHTNNWNQHIYLNGAPVAIRQANSSLTNTIGQGEVGAGYYGGLAEIAVYNTNLTDVQRSDVESYLLTKWTQASLVTSAPFEVYPLNYSLSIIVPVGVDANGNAAGSVTLDLTGISGRTYRLQASANLPSGWMDIATNSAASNGILQFMDPGATNYPSRFYRVVSP